MDRSGTCDRPRMLCPRPRAATVSSDSDLATALTMVAMSSTEDGYTTPAETMSRLALQAVVSSNVRTPWSLSFAKLVRVEAESEPAPTVAKMQATTASTTKIRLDTIALGSRMNNSDSLDRELLETGRSDRMLSLSLEVASWGLCRWEAGSSSGYYGLFRLGPEQESCGTAECGTHVISILEPVPNAAL